MCPCEQPGAFLCSILEADGLEHVSHLLFFGAGHPRQKAAKDPAATTARELEVLVHGVSVKDRGTLKFATDTELANAPLGQPRELDGLILEIDGPRSRACLSGDDIHQRGLACTVRPDDAAQLALVDRQREVLESQESVEIDGDVVDPQHELLLGNDRAALGLHSRLGLLECHGGCAHLAHGRHLSCRETRLEQRAPDPSTHRGRARVMVTKSAPRT